jgi:hypothetical protein
MMSAFEFGNKTYLIGHVASSSRPIAIFQILIKVEPGVAP